MVFEKRFMEEALLEARAAAAEDEVPVGAVVVLNGEIIARAHNRTERLADPTAHAELSALREACDKLSRHELADCALYVTMEPCAMCAGACLLYRIGAVVFGAYDARAGALGSRCDIASGELGLIIPVLGGILREECAGLLTEYFKGKR